MRLGLNLAFLLPGQTGGRETYARELALALAETGPEHDLVSFVNREAAAVPGFWRDVGRVVRLPLSPRSRPAWAWLETAAVTGAAARSNVDVLHSPANFGPFAGPFTRVLTVHDALFRTHPEYVTPLMRAGTGLILYPAARRAHELITVSEASRDDLVRLLHLDPRRITVIPNGWSQPRVPGDAAAARARLGLGDRNVALSVATNLAHKDLPLLVRALSLIPAAERPMLVLAGTGTDDAGLRALARDEGVAPDVALAGRVDERSLEDLYAAASVVVTATRAEGFGLPVIEALGRGIPVACSDIPVLREVAGGFATWFRPGDAHEAAGAIRTALRDDEEQRRLRSAGRAHAEKFSWHSAAQRTWEVYERARRRPGDA